MVKVYIVYIPRVGISWRKSKGMEREMRDREKRAREVPKAIKQKSVRERVGEGDISELTLSCKRERERERERDRERER